MALLFDEIYFEMEDKINIQNYDSFFYLFTLLLEWILELYLPKKFQFGEHNSLFLRDYPREFILN